MQLHKMAEERLRTLESELPLRIGGHGSGATVVTQVLLRSIRKMRLINDVQLHVCQG